MTLSLNSVGTVSRHVPPKSDHSSDTQVYNAVGENMVVQLVFSDLPFFYIHTRFNIFVLTVILPKETGTWGEKQILGSR